MSEQVNTSPFQLFERYPDEEAARFYFEKRRWNCLVVCPHCGCDSRISARTGNRIGYYRCGACNKEFTVRRDTILERSRIPLHKWLHAMARAITMGKNVSLVQFGKDVGVSPKTALAILDRLHEACGDDANPKVTSAVEENDALHMSQKKLDRMTDKVFAYNPNAKSNNVLGVIAGAPDKPLVIGEIEIPCYVLENEERVLTQSGMFSQSRSGKTRIGAYRGRGTYSTFRSIQGHKALYLPSVNAPTHKSNKVFFCRQRGLRVPCQNPP